MLEAEFSSISHDELMSALRLVNKLNKVMVRKAKNAMISYVALKIMLFDLEAYYGVLLSEADEIELKCAIKAMDDGAERSACGAKRK